MNIAITGHRPAKLGDDYALKSPLILGIRQRIQHILTRHIDISMDAWTPLTLITGMALGIDTLFALIAIENKIPFIAAIPCLGQEKKWPQESQRIYNELINHKLCTKKYITSSRYSATCMQKRNEWMVDNCGILIAVWNNSPGGTANCVAYAEQQKKEIIQINPKDYGQQTIPR